MNTNDLRDSYLKLQKLLNKFCIDNKNLISRYYDSNNDLLNINLNKAALIRFESEIDTKKPVMAILKIKKDYTYSFGVSLHPSRILFEEELISNDEIIRKNNLNEYINVVGACINVFENGLFSLDKYLEENKYI